FLFESAAAELAQSAVTDAEAGSSVFLARRFADGWPSIRFLLGDRPVTPFAAQEGLPGPLSGPITIYAWRYDSLDTVSAAGDPPAVVDITPGPLARGDLEPEPYSLYTRYVVTPWSDESAPVADFDA